MNMRDTWRFFTKRIAAVIAVTIAIVLLWFPLNALASEFSVLHSFTGTEGPYSPLALSGSTLYGTSFGDITKDDSTIFKINAQGTGYKVLHTFTGGADGSNTNASLSLSGTSFYGTTQGDGAEGYGTIFKINSDGSGYQVLHNFAGGSDGAAPEASLTLSGSTLYGTTQNGGAEGYGTLFKINSDGTGFQVLHSFTGASGGAYPEGSLTLSGSTLYGTTEGSSTYGEGVIFKINTDGTGYKVLHTFSGDEGRFPAASLRLSGSTLYATNQWGGAYDSGTIFKINTDGTGYQVLHTFTGGPDGYLPHASLTLSDSTLYGTTQYGGAENDGTIFKINSDGTGFQVLYNFTGGANASDPFASLTLSGTILYGTTEDGGADGDGTIFSFTVSTPPTYYYGQTSDSGYVAEPVNTALGNYAYKHIDLKIPGRGPGLEISRSYNSQDGYDGPLGYGWTYTYNMLLRIDGSGNVTVKYPDGHEEGYIANSDGTFSPAWGGIYSTLVKNSDSTYTLTDKAQTRYDFSSAGKLTSITDKNGNAVTLSYTGTNLTTVTGPAGRTLSLSYDSNGHITKITDPLGRTLSYTYDADGNLASYTDPGGGVWNYSYDSSHQVTQITDPDGNVLLKNIYTAGKVTSQTNGRGYTTSFQYDTPGSGETTVTDPLGNVSIYTHDANHRVTQVKDPLGHTISYSYDTNGNRTQVTDKNGNVTRYTYDSMGNLTSKTDALGDITTITYDADNNPLTRTDALGNTTTYVYDSNGNLIKMTDPLGNVTTYAYDGYGELASKTDANGSATLYTYDADGNPSGIQDALGDTTAYTYDAAGRVLSKTDADGNTTTYAYDASDNLVSIKDALGHVQSFTYDADNNRTSYTDKNGDTTTTTYDANDEPVAITDALGHKTSITYDALDRKSSVTDPSGGTTSFTYDGAGNLIEVTDPLGNNTTFTCDANGNRLTAANPLGQTTQFTYDALNRLTETTDPMGDAVTRTYDALGRLTSVTNADGNATTYAYDARDKLVKVTEPGGAITTYAYDALGNRIAMTDARGQTTQYTRDKLGRLSGKIDAAGDATTYQYDPAGNLISLEHPDGEQITYSYDALNRLREKDYPTGTPTVFTYDANGNLTQMTDRLGTSTWTYDARNRRLNYTDPFGKEVQYGYDSDGNRITIIYPGDHEVDYAYDAANRLVMVTDWLGDETTYQYDAAGDLTKTTLPNGGTASYGYDEAARLTSLTNTKPDGSVINGYTYTLDRVGNQTGEKRNEPLQVTLPDAKISATFGEDNRLETMGDITYTHDADGNLTAVSGAQSATFKYDADDRLTEISNGDDIQYQYDGLGHRLSRTVDGATTRYVLDTGRPLPTVLAETSQDGAVSDYFIYGLGLLYKLLPDGTAYYYHYDGRGSTIAITDKDGSVVNDYAYTPFGGIAKATEGTANPFCLAGQYGIMYEGGAIYYMRARYYDTGTGRFLSKDPYPGYVTSPQTLNKYIYALDNPVVYVDPSGHWVFGAFAGAVEGGISGFEAGLNNGDSLSACIVGGVVGGVAGGAVGAVLPPVAGELAAGAVGGAAGAAAVDYVSKKPVSLASVATGGVHGLISSALNTALFPGASLVVDEATDVAPDKSTSIAASAHEAVDTTASDIRDDMIKSVGANLNPIHEVAQIEAGVHASTDISRIYRK